ncbi:ArsR family transcriptional regulator [Streptomyces sp. NPDC056600]|uniref:ArsR family transcriptional regulator n=1 Tax=Streptomyces sp. NPDC056600 TaxID=3345874 RepID=UPI00369F2615
MLRIHFTDADLARVRLSAAPDPLWEACLSLHRLRAAPGQGRLAFAPWRRTALERLRESGLARTVRGLLMPLVPPAGYFPDFLTPPESADGLDAGLRAIVDTTPERVLREVGASALPGGAPAWVSHLAERDVRDGLARALRAYHDAVVAPHGDRAQACVEARAARHAREVLADGVDGLLRGLGDRVSWDAPVLSVRYPVDRDLFLRGRGLRLIPSSYCWGNPVAYADPALEPVLVYPLVHESHGTPDFTEFTGGKPLAVLLGRTRAAVLLAAAGGAGATTGELARLAGVSASSASQHATALRNTGLLLSHRHAGSVLHTLTPLGAALLGAGGRPAGIPAPRRPVAG